MMRPLLSGLVGILLFTLTVPRTWAVTYYVDPSGVCNATCSDDNAGTDPMGPWCTPPGTLLATSNAYVSGGTWGSTLACNDTILLCGCASSVTGTECQNSADGGIWRWTPAYYPNCTEATPIEARVATNAEWAGSTGHFIWDGTGVTAFPTAGQGGPECRPDTSYPQAVLCVGGNHSFKHVRGASDSQRFVIRDAPTAFYTDGAGGGTRQGLWLDWVEFFNLSNYIIAWRGASYSLISNARLHDTSYGSGWNIGLNNDSGGRVSRVALVNSEVYNSGSTTQNNGDQDAIMGFNTQSLYVLNVTARNNRHRGLDIGCVFAPNCTDYLIVARNFRSHNNGTACPGANCVGAGLLNSWENGIGGTGRVVCEGCTFYGNQQVGAGTYVDGQFEAWGLNTFRTQASLRHDSTGGQLWLFNHVNQGQSGHSLWSTNNSGSNFTQRCLAPITGNNCLRPISANTETLGVGHCSLANGTYASPPSYYNGMGNILGTSCAPNFTSIGGACAAGTFSACDFTPSAGSSLIDTGRFMMVANGAGSNANTIAVAANGGTADPRQLFVATGGTAAQRSFYKAELFPQYGQVQIQGACGLRHIVAMTATAITFDGPPCSWVNGAGISLGWNGDGPDIGAVESGTPSTTTTTVPGQTTTSTTSTSSTIAATSTSTSTSTSSTSSSTILGAWSTRSVRFYGARSLQNDRIRIPVDGPEQPVDVGSGAFTLEFWIRGTKADNDTEPPGAPNAPYRAGDTVSASFDWFAGNIVVDRDIDGNPAAGGGDWGASIHRAGSSSGADVLRFGAQNSAGTQLTIQGSTDILDDTWHHVAFGRDTSNRLFIVVDGAEDYRPANTITGSLAYPDGTGSAEDPTLTFATEKHAFAGFHGFEGYLDEIRVWSVERSVADLASNRFATLGAATPGLELYLRLEEGDTAPNPETLVDWTTKNSGVLLYDGVAGNGEWSTSFPTAATTTTSTSSTSSTSSSSTSSTSTSSTTFPPPVLHDAQHLGADVQGGAF